MQEPSYWPFPDDPPRPVMRKRRLTPWERFKRRARRRALQALVILIGLALVAAVVTGAVFLVRALLPERAGDDDAQQTQQQQQEVSGMPELSVDGNAPQLPAARFTLTETVNTRSVGEEIPSEFVVVADYETGEIVAAKNADARISPASMTKILTLLVAVEHIEDMDATFTMNIEVSDYCFSNDCSVVGYELDEVISARELLYGCIMESGADACLGLAQIAAGSHENFVALMNEKLKELGLAETAHFTNCVGLYDKEHYCTVKDMATMLRAAMENETCREILSTKKLHTETTTQHPDGMDLSNWFLRRIEDKDSGNVEVLCGKTGFVNQSGCCAASAGVRADGETYLCVTGNAWSQWQSIYDHVALYKAYCASAEG